MFMRMSHITFVDIVNEHTLNYKGFVTLFRNVSTEPGWHSTHNSVYPNNTGSNASHQDDQELIVCYVYLFFIVLES